VDNLKYQNLDYDYLFIFCTHNRVTKTLNFLRLLVPQIEELGLSHRIYMLDDKSTDGTKSQIKEMFPQVKILDGTGNLFWAGGMRKLYKIVSNEILYKHLVVLNDDILLNKNTFKLLLNEYLQLILQHQNMCILSACFLDPNTNKTSYSGFMRQKYHPLAFKKINSIGIPIEVDAINMNLAFIPKRVLEECGFLSDLYQHSKADIDYSVRAKEKNVRLFISGKTTGYCSANPPKRITDIMNEKRGILANFNNPKGISFIETYYFYSRNGNTGWQLYLMLVYIKYIIIFLIAKCLKLISNFYNRK
jgi:GT2 family glycosyltransferase